MIALRLVLPVLVLPLLVATSGRAQAPVYEVVGPAHAAGDLDGDGREDRALVVRARHGSARWHAFVVVIEATATSWQRVATIRLEDGAEVDRLRISAGRLTVAYRRPYAVDPPCCPSSETVRTFAQAGDSLLGDISDAPAAAWERAILAVRVG